MPKTTESDTTSAPEMSRPTAAAAGEVAWQRLYDGATEYHRRRGAIAALPARTRAGVVAKARVVRASCIEALRDNYAVAASIVADLLAERSA